MSSKLLRGTFILTIGTILSKVLGLVYVFPFYALVGEQGGALYSYAYIPYTIILSIATMGVPLAVSKFVAKYNALGEYGVGRRLFKSGLILMSLTGVAAFLLLYLLAPVLAPMIVLHKNEAEDVVLVLRAVSFALLLVPAQSIIRGFFQGHESMGPTAVSQVIEQIARIIFLLAGVYVVLNIMGGSLTTAISVATFAAFIGALGGLLVLVWYWMKRRKHLNELLEQDKGELDISLKDMYKELVLYAAPFVFVGLANPLFQFVDEFTFNRAMAGNALAGKSSELFAMLATYSHKLVIIPVSLATSFGLTLIPTITKSFVEGDQALLNKYLNQTFQVVLFLTLPAVVGLSLLAGPAYATFYSASHYGGEILAWYAPVAILFSLFAVTAAILQGINQQRFTVIGLVIGLAIKLALNSILVAEFAAIGAIVATAIGYLAACIFNLLIIGKYANYKYEFVIRRSLLIFIFTGAMAVGVKAALWVLSMGLSYEDGRLQAILIITISALVGGGIYFYLSYRSKLLFLLLGNRLPFLKKKNSTA